MSRQEARGRGQGLLPPYLEPGPPSPDQAQFKPKRKLMTKFFNEPVDALDLRLANAEENLSTLPVDPFTDIKQEEEPPPPRGAPSPCPPDTRALGYNATQVITANQLHRTNLQQNVSHEALPLPMDEEAESDVQRVTLTAGSILSRPRPSPPTSGGHSGGQGWRISPIPWRMMLSSSDASDPGAGPSSSPDYSHPPPHRHNSSPDLVTSHKRPLEDSDQGPSNLKIRRPNPEQEAREYDDIDRKISMAESTNLADNPLFVSCAPELGPLQVKQEAEETPEAWWRSPAPGYMRRCQDLLVRDIKTETRPGLPPGAESASHHYPGHHHVVTPQRKSSVIVRHTSGAPPPPVHSERLPQFPLAAPPLSPIYGEQRQEHWLKQLQHLRSGIAYKMMECRHQQAELQQHHSRQLQTQERLFGGHHHGVPRFPASLPFPGFPPSTRTNRDYDEPLRTQKGKSGQTRDNSAAAERLQGLNPEIRSSSSAASNVPEAASLSPGHVTSTSPSLAETEAAEVPQGPGKGKRGRPRKHAPKLPLPPLYVFIRNLLHNPGYNPSVIAWVDDEGGCFKVTNTLEFAKTWGRMKSNRSEEMNYEKMSRAMRYHYGCERQGRKGHLAMVKEKRLYYKFGELARNWRSAEVSETVKARCSQHELCRTHMCLWSKE